MNSIGIRRSEIYDHFHSNSACQKFFFDPANGAAYAAYYNSMYLLQDSTESLQLHRARDFSEEPLTAYLEFWGVLQAIIIQQDSIVEIYETIVGQSLNPHKIPAWKEVRELRNICAGHPAKLDRSKHLPLKRAFVGRTFGNYETFTYEQWQQGEGRSHPRIHLGKLFDKQAEAAEAQLAKILSAMKRRWP
ncbi:hypothetical protein [Rhodanobacter sp. C03]|uniref:hypothetical protein n=1 Tax=Rhodanobacter sp. C03 TaxID=1945858 RepID=UPI00111578C9|nr:hypothetical protein [Rhodanobacter sp. C03]